MQSVGIISDGKTGLCYNFLKNSGAVEPMVIEMKNAENFAINILEILPEEWYNLKKDSMLLISDDEKNIGKYLKNQSLCVISCGLSGKASVSLSSMDGGKTVVCILRSIFTLKGKEIIPQEFTVKADVDSLTMFPLLASVTALLLCGVPKKTIETLQF